MVRQKKVSYSLSLFFLLFNSFLVFAEDKTQTLSQLLSTNNMKLFFENLEPLNWILYFAVILLFAFILRDVVLEKVNMPSRLKFFLSLLVSFCGVTGVFWVLLIEKVMPVYFVFLGGEFLVLALAIGIPLLVWRRSSNVILRVFVIGSALILLMSYHSMIVGNQSDIATAASMSSLDGTLLLSLVSFFPSVSISPWLLLLIIVVYIGLFQAGSMGANVLNQPLFGGRRGNDNHGGGNTGGGRGSEANEEEATLRAREQLIREIARLHSELIDLRDREQRSGGAAP